MTMALDPSPGFAGRQPRVLVADDEQGIRELLVWELESQGCDVVAVADGAAAIEIARLRDFDLVVSDIRMPKVDGLGVLKAVKEDSPDTQVVIATGYAEMAHAIECVRQGAFDFIQKPFDMSTFLAIAARAIEHRRLRRTAALYEASRSMLAHGSSEGLDELVIELTRRSMRCDEVSLLGIDTDGTFALLRRTPLELLESSHRQWRLGEGVVGRVAESGEPAVIAREEHPGGLPCSARTVSSIVFPLRVRGRVVRILSLHRHDTAFRQVDLECAGILAAEASLALENAHLVRTVATNERLTSAGLIAAGVAHEISNPVAFVLANQSYLAEQVAKLAPLFTSLERGDGATAIEQWRALEGTGLHARLRESVEDLGTGATRVRDIVKDLGTLTRSNKSRARIDVNDAIRSALRITRAELTLRAEVDCELGDGLRVLASSGSLSQVFVNLLVNACQSFGDRSRDNNRITVRSERCGDRVVATVRDTGSGIPTDQLQRIFQTFYTTKESGTGLGLAISRDIVETHGGELRVRSEPGTGSTFEVSLPFAPAEEAPQVGLVENRKRILFIDDEAPMLRAYAREFGKAHETATATSGEEALAILAARTDFDVIVCDLVMPKMDGREVYRRAVASVPMLATRFVFVTAGGMPETELRRFERSVGGPILVKPGAIVELRERLGR
jgi:two-component system, NtrC family, sensor kinase